jgi:large subunit ribosomal protein L4
MAVDTYTKTGNKATTAAKLDKAVFGVAPTNHELLKRAYLAYLANKRTNNAVTLKRGEVRGGGRKPWRQKGTGRARFGSIRNPIWRGGGIAFGPTGHENYQHKLPTKTKRVAVRQALSLAADSTLKVVESLTISSGKTKDAAALLNKIGVTGQTLLIVKSRDDGVTRSFQNLGNVKLVTAKYVTVYDVLNADHVVITTDALHVLSDWLAGAKA